MVDYVGWRSVKCVQGFRGDNAEDDSVGFCQGRYEQLNLFQEYAKYNQFLLANVLL